MTSEQITQLVADLQTRLDTCSQAGQAYRLKWHEVKVVIEAMRILQQRLAEANDFNNDVVEREAAVCPEDVGFDEYIRALQSQLEQLRAENERLRSAGAEAMRNGCVAKVETMHSDIAGYLRRSTVLTALESLTLDTETQP